MKHRDPFADFDDKWDDYVKRHQWALDFVAHAFPGIAICAGIAAVLMLAAMGLGVYWLATVVF